MPFLSSRPVAVSEGAAFAEFVVRLDAPAASEIRVGVQTDNVSAAYTQDYTFLRETLVFAPGETSKTVRVPILANTTAEGPEVFWLQLYSPVGASIEQPDVAGIIFDDDGATGGGTLSVGDVLVDESAGTAQFLVTLSRPSTTAVSVGYATADDDATAGSDYGAASGTLNFAAGERVKTVTVPLLNDGTPEGDEFFFLRLANPVNASIADGEGLAMIGRNDGGVTSNPQVFVTPMAVDESSLFASFAIQLSAPSANVVSLSWQTDNASAEYNRDHFYLREALVFQPGQTLKTIQVPLIDDATTEAVEHFDVTLFSATGAVIPRASTPVFLYDNDGTAGTPAIRVSDPVVDESAQTARFFVSLSRPSSGGVTVNYATADDSALAGSDYRAATGTLAFAPGETVKTVIVKLLDDGQAETDEFFRLALSNPSGATLADGAGTATIGANDAPAASAPRVSVQALTVGEGDGYAPVVIQLSAPSTNEVRISYQTDNVTAEYNRDHHYLRETLIFAPGETTKLVQVPLIDDSVAEPEQLFYVNLYSPVNASVPRQFTPVVIVDNDGTSGTPAISVSDPVVDESAQAARFVVTLDKPSTAPVTLAWSTADADAVAGADYRAASGTLSFAPGEVTQTVVIDIVDDAQAETDEFFQLQLAAPSGATLADAVGQALIGRSDAQPDSRPWIGVAPAAASEGQTFIEFTAQLSAPSATPVSFSFQTDNLSAAYNQDHDYTRQTLTFAPGQTTLPIRVPLLDDTAAEATETFWLNLYSPVNGLIAAQYVPGLIIDDDGTAGTPAVSVADVVVDETAQLARFVVSLSRVSTQTVTVAWATADDTARAGSDYAAAAGTLSFAPGEMVQTVAVRLVDDGLTEGPEAFQMKLASPVNATLGDAVGAAIIGRSDGPTVARPVVSAGVATASEGDSFLNVVLQLSAPSHNTVSVNWQTDNASAVYNQDFYYEQQTAVFAPGETVRLLRVPLIDGTVAEGNEALTLRLSAPVNATLAATLLNGAILDNDSGFTVLSQGLSNDLYNVSSSLARIAENAGGGIDTVRASATYTLPENVENLLLTGGAVNAIGNAGHNVLRGNAGNNTLDGRDGIDTVQFGSALAAYTIAGTSASRTVTGGADGSDTLLAVERLQFADTMLASDTLPGQNTFLAYAMFNAAFDRGPGPAELAQWTSQLDRLGSTRELAQTMINTYAPGVSDEVLVAYLWGTIVETAIPLEALEQYVGLVGNGTFTQASLLEVVATLDLNTAEIAGIVGQTLPLDVAYFPPLG